MSVINEMLRDLEQRESLTNVGSGVTATNVTKPRAPRYKLVGASLFLLMSGVVGVYGLSLLLGHRSDSSTVDGSFNEILNLRQGRVEKAAMPVNHLPPISAPVETPGEGAAETTSGRSDISSKSTVIEPPPEVSVHIGKSDAAGDNTPIAEVPDSQALDQPEHGAKLNISSSTRLVVPDEIVPPPLRTESIVNQYLSHSASGSPKSLRLIELSASQDWEHSAVNIAQTDDSGLGYSAVEYELGENEQKNGVVDDVKVSPASLGGDLLTRVDPVNEYVFEPGKGHSPTASRDSGIRNVKLLSEDAVLAKPFESEGLRTTSADARGNSQLARMSLQQGDSIPAERLLAAATPAQRNSADMKLLDAQLAVSKGEKSRALGILRNFPPPVVGHEDYYQLWAALAFQQADYATAERLYQQLLAYQPSDSKLLMGLGFSLKFLGEAAVAKSVFQRALRGDGLTTKARQLVVSELLELAK